LIENERLAQLLRKFAADRDWQQFHTPKNLATALTVEAAELLEIFQWSRGQQGWSDLEDPNVRTRTEEEMADILLYLIRFADLAGIDLQQVAEAKMQANSQKYPAEQFKGSDKKYNE